MKATAHRLITACRVADVDVDRVFKHLDRADLEQYAIDLETVPKMVERLPRFHAGSHHRCRKGDVQLRPVQGATAGR